MASLHPRLVAVSLFALFTAFLACSDDDSSDGGGNNAGNAGSAGSNSNNNGGAAGGSNTVLPKASCTAAETGSASVTEPTLLIKLADRWEESWLASPAVADLDGDGTQEIVVAREGKIVTWHADGTKVWDYDGEKGRIWASPIVADLRDDSKLEIIFAARDTVFVLDSEGQPVSGFPVTWNDELRSLAVGDVDGDGQLDIIAATTDGGPGDVIIAWHANGNVVAGYPPYETGTSGCESGDGCYLAGCYDQNLAVGDLDGDGKQDIIAPHDNAYTGFYKGSGELFDANSMFPVSKTEGVRYMHKLDEAKQGYAEDEATALQAHFTNTAPAIADIDGDGTPEVIMLGSVQNAAQDNREQGVGLWVLHSDASRHSDWQTPFHAPDYLAGLWDYEGVNIVAATNQVTIADINADSAGLEMIFVGFDGRIHAVSADQKDLWSFTYTQSANVLSGGVVVADLSGDGVPEIVFNTYSIDDGAGALFVLDANGNKLHELSLPGHGAMPVPTIGDVNGDGTLEIVVSLKDAEDGVESVRVFTVPGSSTNCLLWPTGRGNYYRNGWVR